MHLALSIAVQYFKTKLFPFLCGKWLHGNLDSLVLCISGLMHVRCMGVCVVHGCMCGAWVYVCIYTLVGGRFYAQMHTQLHLVILELLRGAAPSLDSASIEVFPWPNCNIANLPDVNSNQNPMARRKIVSFTKMR